MVGVAALCSFQTPRQMPGSTARGVDGRYERSYRYTVVDTIGGGTSEVQKNIIAGRGLGLPKTF